MDMALLSPIVSFSFMSMFKLPELQQTGSVFVFEGYLRTPRKPQLPGEGPGSKQCTWREQIPPARFPSLPLPFHNLRLGGGFFELRSLQIPFYS